jgi:hypothetical protein
MMSASPQPGRHRRILARTSQEVVKDFRNQLPSRMRVSKSKEFRDGKHLAFHLMFDQLMMLEQLGLVVPPAAAA